MVQQVNTVKTSHSGQFQIQVQAVCDGITSGGPEELESAVSEPQVKQIPVSDVQFVGLPSIRNFLDKFEVKPSDFQIALAICLGKGPLIDSSESYRRRFKPPYMMLVTIGLAALAMRCTNGDFFTDNMNMLVDFSVICTAIGFVFCSIGALIFGLNNDPGAAAAGRITSGIGCTASAYAFLALTAMLMPENVMLEITGVAFVASFPAIFYAIFRKSKDDHNRVPILPISVTLRRKYSQLEK
ncbi:hypothetical protein Pint_26121 [Pistacia integerrima]|uniref:Uncharacterized protein n=1 Tax=Pistacia integerrima TaxID=434235 RepID=A0ACC0YIQ1_9ROSI|nr:hypothetical protein Pint_26121 [Pistacia integerrima]